jgi:hypothetical protein
VHIGDNGEITHCSPKSRCVLSAGERCMYFEECVAPMADVVKEPRRAKAVQEAVLSYRMAHAGVLRVTQHRRHSGQRGNLTSQKPQEGLCLPLQRKQSEKPHEDSGCIHDDPLTVETAATGRRSAVA